MVTMDGFEPPLDRLSTCCLCQIGLHGHWVPPGGPEPPPHGLRTRHAASTLQRGIWFGLRVTIPSLHAGNVECSLHTQAEHGPVSFTGPSTLVSYQRTHSCELVGSKGFEPNRSRWENGVTARQRTIRSYRPLATAPGFEPGPTRFGGSDASVTPRCRCCFTSRRSQRQNLPMT